VIRIPPTHRHPALLLAALAVLAMPAAIGAAAAEPTASPAALPPAAAAPAATAPAALPAGEPLPAVPAGGPTRFDLARPEIAAFIKRQVAQGWNRTALRKLLAQAESQPKIIDAMNRPAEKALSWWEYRARFMTQERVETGARLWREHRAELEAAAAAHGVEPEYILAIIGVETYYGRITGRYRVLDALATLAFDYPPRSEYFRKELEQYLQIVRAGELDPLTTLGSYAGAMGVTQFMPSSFRNFAVNEGGSEKRDLWNDWADIFGSVANYFHGNGWVWGQQVLAEAELGTAPEPATPTSVVLNETLGALRGRGMQVASDLTDNTPCVLLAAPEASGPHWRIGLRNFYVITRYNRSPLYAMVVHDLAKALRARVQSPDAP
jgi:membrane-bound lytic murein transglycosylase B